MSQEPKAIQVGDYLVSLLPIEPHYEAAVSVLGEDRIKSMYRRVHKKSDKKILEELPPLIEQYPDIPLLRNFLSAAYSVRGDNERAYAINDAILQKHPDYFLARINKAQQYHSAGHIEEIPGVLGHTLRLRDLYPERKRFHAGELQRYYEAAAYYLLQTGQLEAAHDRMVLLVELDERDLIEMDKGLWSLFLKMPSIMEGEEEDEEADYPEQPSAGKPLPPQSVTPPTFALPDTHLLYLHRTADMTATMLNRILEQPRQPLIEDLCAVLEDCARRFDVLSEEVDTHDLAIHALFMLGELQAEEALPFILEFLSYEEGFVDFWLDELLTEQLWQVIYQTGRNRLHQLQTFLLQEDVYIYAKSAVRDALVQMTYHEPERSEEVYAIYRQIFEAALAKGKNNVDLEDTGFAVGELLEMRTRPEALLPLALQLHDEGLVPQDFHGDKEDYLKFYKEGTERKSWEIEPIVQLYGSWHKHTESSPPWQAPQLPVKRSEPKLGRNDPCPCGSGKKYKKCCLGKVA